jgi:hypothetical protein
LVLVLLVLLVGLGLLGPLGLDPLGTLGLGLLGTLGLGSLGAYSWSWSSCLVLLVLLR